jgi:predicted dehydrogenase
MNENKPYSCLIVGLGQIGMGYDLNLDSEKYIYTHARAFSMHPGYELKGGVDDSLEKRQLFTKHYGCPAYESIDYALNEFSPDIIIIAVPTNAHVSLIEKILSKIKPQAILCEKPLASTLKHGRKLIELCKKVNTQLYVNYMRRSVPGVNEIKRRIDTGSIKLPVKGIVWYTKGFLHNGSHFFNLLEYWLGDFKEARVINDGRELEGVGAEPQVQVTFSNNVVDFIPAKEENFSHYTVELISASGRLYWGQGHLTWQKANIDPIIKSYKKLSSAVESIPTGMEKYQWHVTVQLLLALTGKSSRLCTGEQALSTLENMQNIINLGEI